MTGTRIAGVVFLALALITFGDRMGLYQLSATMLLSALLIGVGLIIIARAAGEDRHPVD